MQNIKAVGRSWPYKWFGFFRTAQDFDDQLPSREVWTASDWLPNDKDEVIQYLSDAVVIVAASAGTRSCEICGEQLSIGCFCSDGEWLWPDDLSHFVARHSVVVPEGFLEKIRAMNYLPPTTCDVPLENLPWPTA